MPISYNSEIITTNRYDASGPAGYDGVSRGTFQNKMKALLTSVANRPTNMFKPVAILALGITAAFALSVLVRQFNAAYAADMDGPSPNNAMVKFRPQDQCEAYYRTENQEDCEVAEQHPSQALTVILPHRLSARDISNIVQTVNEHYRPLLHSEKKIDSLETLLCGIASVIIGVLLINCVPFR